jgi:hypothetical protein
MSIINYLRINERLSSGPCRSDMRFDAWKVAIQGSKENGFYPRVDTFKEYYASTEIGSTNIKNCHIQFDLVHNFFLEQLFYGGLLWLSFLIIYFSILISKNRKNILSAGFLGFLGFLFFSPTYAQFYMYLILWITLLTIKKINI